MEERARETGKKEMSDDVTSGFLCSFNKNFMPYEIVALICLIKTLIELVSNKLSVPDKGTKQIRVTPPLNRQ